MTRSCYTCSSSLTCFLRIEFARTIQSFKLLTETRREAQNVQCPGTTEDIYGAIANACSAFVEKSNEVRVSGVPYKINLEK